MEKKVRNIFLIFVTLSLTFALFAYASGQDSGTHEIPAGWIVVPPPTSGNVYSVVYDEFKNGLATTNFSILSDAQLGSIAGMTLDNSAGKIVWNEVVNLTEVHFSNVISLDSNFEIASNSIAFNGEIFTNLAKSATLTFYGVSFTNPQLMKNGATCNDCNFVSYSGGNYIFTTTLPTENVVYAVVEQTTTTPPSGGSGGGGSGGGGGGGGGPPSSANFTFSEEVLHSTMEAGDSTSKSFVITNTGTLPLNFVLSIGSVESFVTLSETTFSLPVGGTKSLTANFFVPEGEGPAVHTGKITATASGVSKDLNLIVEIVEELVLFDINSQLSSDRLTKDEPLETTINLQDVGNVGNVNVMLEYFVKDYEDNEIKLGEDGVNVDGTAQLEKSFVLSEETFPPGDYAFYVRLSYEDNTATSVNPFRIVDLKLVVITGFVFFVIVISLLAILVIYTWYRYTWNKKIANGLAVPNSNSVKPGA